MHSSHLLVYTYPDYCSSASIPLIRHPILPKILYHSSPVSWIKILSFQHEVSTILLLIPPDPFHHLVSKEIQLFAVLIARHAAFAAVAVDSRSSFLCETADLFEV